MALSHEGVAHWLVNHDEERGICEMYAPRKPIERSNNTINKAPTIEPKQGEWEYVDDRLLGYAPFHRCRECGEEMYTTKDNFCPNCGADMRGGI